MTKTSNPASSVNGHSQTSRSTAGDDGIFGAGVFGVEDLKRQLGLTDEDAREFLSDNVAHCQLSNGEMLFTKEAFRDAIDRLSAERATCPLGPVEDYLPLALEKRDKTHSLSLTAEPTQDAALQGIKQNGAKQHRGRPNIVLLTVGHTGSTICMRILGALGWQLGDADSDYGESVSVRECNQKQNWSKASEALAALPAPWAIKDPRFCEFLDEWLSALEPYSPTLLWLTRDDSDTANSFRRRGESIELMQRRLTAAQGHFDRWTGPKVRIDYGQLKAAAGLFHR